VTVGTELEFSVDLAAEQDTEVVVDYALHSPRAFRNADRAARSTSSVGSPCPPA
jgi:hypothetical protein